MQPTEKQRFSQVYYLGFKLYFSGIVLGVNLRSIIPIKAVKLEDLSGKILAIDAYNALYQFLAIIRQPVGTPLKDGSGKV